eukprot:256105-Rhodomonas_salina.1
MSWHRDNSPANLSPMLRGWKNWIHPPPERFDNRRGAGRSRSFLCCCKTCSAPSGEASDPQAAPHDARDRSDDSDRDDYNRLLTAQLRLRCFDGFALGKPLPTLPYSLADLDRRVRQRLMPVG